MTLEQELRRTLEQPQLSEQVLRMTLEQVLRMTLERLQLSEQALRMTLEQVLRMTLELQWRRMCRKTLELLQSHRHSHHSQMHHQRRHRHSWSTYLQARGGSRRLLKECETE